MNTASHRYPAMQLPLYERCDVCGRIIFGFTTGAPNPPHRACGTALDRWIRADNLDHCIEVFGLDYLRVGGEA